MDTAKAEMLFNYFASNGIKNLKIMGGEPTVHPDFLTLYNLSQQKFDSVALLHQISLESLKSLLMEIQIYKN